MLRRLFLPLLALALPALLAAEQCVVIGDSLTKEYEVEFPALFPQNPESWDSRNWIEILHQRRTGWFDTGPFAHNNDPRLVGHEYNWAFPGATAVEIKNQLNNPFNFWWTDKIKNHLKNTAERVVIFAGGNDVDSYYANIYNGAAPAAYTNATRDSLHWIVDFVRSQKSTLPIVLVAVPHLGCAPDIQLQCPTDPVKTARVTAALDALNSQLAAFAQSRGIAFAPGVYDLTKQMID
ncbi:MAG TPA: GDSL-type esterase/lipase family protein, partial [Prosthecobacter sp.]|nr:GDSL-type esterase/lipase family protein [Prosthecobacter sp.]